MIVFACRCDNEQNADKYGREHKNKAPRGAISAPAPKASCTDSEHLKAANVLPARLFACLNKQRIIRHHGKNA